MSDVHRREFLRKAAVTGVAVGGATWAVPSVLGFDHTLAAVSPGSPLTAVAGTAVAHTNNGNDFPTATVPAGTFTSYLLVVVTQLAGGGAPTISGAGWTTTPIASTTTPASSPGLFVYLGSSASGSVSVTGVKKDNLSAQVFGIGSGTTAAAATVQSGSAGTISSIAGLSAQPATSGYVLIAGSTLGGGSTANWTTPPGFTSLSDLGTLPAGLPDIYFAISTTTGTSVATLSSLSYTSASGPAQAVQVRLS